MVEQRLRLDHQWVVPAEARVAPGIVAYVAGIEDIIASKEWASPSGTSSRASGRRFGVPGPYR
ncbi:hypothetical protein [Iamia sp.]|uniref:hypothetical protein n=1 Tax=Iamia sp. TaxID=2722710 RepID=UPI002C2A52C8|nr:hypothetical protein [Iamia sp.]HXH55783.1 hypothetical protein [Iamia sp.]